MFSLTCNCCVQSITFKKRSKVFENVEWSNSLLRHFIIQTLLKKNCCIAAISAFRVTQHNQIFKLFFRNRIQCIALYQLHNSQALLNLRHGYFKLQLHDAIYRLRFYSKSLTHILSLSNSHNNVASIQKNRADKSHSVIVALLKFKVRYDHKTCKRDKQKNKYLKNAIIFTSLRLRQSHPRGKLSNTRCFRKTINRAIIEKILNLIASLKAWLMAFLKHHVFANT